MKLRLPLRGAWPAALPSIVTGAALLLATFPNRAVAGPMPVNGTPVPFTVFNTGVDAAGALLPDGAVDPHYTIVGAPDSRPLPADAFVAYGANSWVADGPLSKWIGPSTGATGPNGNYTYRTTFNLTGFDPATAMLTGQYSTDNNGVDVLLNGTSLGLTTSYEQFVSWAPLSINSGFRDGLNTLDFVLYEGGAVTGVRVEMKGTAVPGTPVTGVPEPGTLALLLSGGLPLLAMTRQRKA